MNREKSVETCLIISTGFLFLYFVLHIKVFILVSFLVGLAGIFIKPAASLLAWAWFKLGDYMGVIVSKLMLTIVYIFILLPLAFFYRLAKKDPLQLKKQTNTYWKIRNHKYTRGDLERIW
jgi:uncharacterized membrane protein